MSVYLPLDQYLSDSLPAEFPQWESDTLDEVYVAPVSVPPPDPDTDTYAEPFETEILFDAELGVSLPGLDAVELLLAPGGGGTLVSLEVELDPATVRLVDVPLAIRLDETVLKPAEAVEPADSDGSVHYQPHPDGGPVEITLAEVTIEVDMEGNVDFDMDSSIDLPLVMIGETGIAIEAEALEFYFGDAAPDDKPAAWRGITLSSASLYLPGELGGAIGDLTLEDAAIGNGGFSGSISSTWEPAIEATLFDIDFELASAEVSIVQNAFTACQLSGSLKLPFFEEAIDVGLGIAQDGAFTVSASQDDGLYTFSKPAFEAELESLEFHVADGQGTLTVGGTLAPDVGYDIPPIEIAALEISSDGSVSLPGGWIDLDDQYSIELAGFGLEITEFGIGRTDDDRKWIGLNGSVQLLEGVPAGASAEGLRIVWDESDPGSFDVSLDGVGVEFEVPNAVRFAGSVAFSDDEFRGEINLELLALDMTIDAELVFGSTTLDGETVDYMGVRLDATLPSGIPLWATGLALYGFGGLFANNLEPDKGDEQDWFAVSGRSEDSWYHQDTPGVMPLSKWRPAADAMAFGASVDLATVSDNGLAVATDVTLVLSFPGPVIMLQGRAALLEEGAVVGADAPYQAVIILDNNAGSLTVGVDARYDKSPLLDISASAEAYYSFADPEAWYLNLGVDDPREDRIRAEALSIFTAESYFMLDPNRLAVGIWSGYDAEWSFGPLGVEFASYVESDARVNFHPPHFYGMVQYNGNVQLRAFGIGAGMTVHAGVEADVFTPMHLRGSFEVAMDLPWPLPDPSATVSLEWGPQPAVPAPPKPLESTAIGHERLASTWAGEKTGSDSYASADSVPDPSSGPTGDEPVVPLDSRPEVTFSRPVTNHSDVADNQHAPEPAAEVIGDPAKDEGPADAVYELLEVNLLAWDETNQEWTDAGPLEGDWAPVPEMGDDGSGAGSDRLTQTKLQLLTRTPYHYSRNAGGAWEDAIDRHYPDYPCPAERHCYAFDGLELADFDHELQYLEDTLLHRLQRTTHAQEPWARFYLEDRGDLTPLVNLVATDGPSGTRRALAIVDRFSAGWDADKRGETVSYANHFDVHLPEALQSVRVHIRAAMYASQGTVQAVNETGADPNSETWELEPGEERTLVFTVPGGELPQLTFEFNGSLALVEVCDATTDLSAELDETDEAGETARTKLERWETQGAVLEPYTSYQLELITKTHVTGRGALNAHEETTVYADYVSFQTEGPPGISEPDLPVGAEKSESGLETLDRYVAQTTPPTIPASGESVQLPGPVYRADTVGVDFVADYVDLMYRLANRDLGVYLFDANDNPVRDHRGTLVVPSDPWRPTETLYLDASTRRWFDHLADNPCVDISDVAIEPTKRIDSASATYVLDPDSVYEARLIPRLLVETWADGGAGTWEASGSGTWSTTGHDGFEGTDATWISDTRVRFDDGSLLSSLTPHRDTISFGNASVYPIIGIDQSTNEVTLGGDPATSVGTGSYEIPARTECIQSDTSSGETAYRLTGNSDLPSGDPDQPAQWRALRLVATLGTEASNGTVGLLLHSSDSAEYRLEFAAGTCRLVRIEGLSDAADWEASCQFTPGMDHRVCVELLDDTIHVLLDDTSVLQCTDPDGPASGTIGLYTEDSDLRCSSLMVDDFRAGAPVAYHFGFQTSSYVDPYHHLHSFNDEHWTGTGVATADLPLADTGDPTELPTRNEVQSYRTIVPDISGLTAEPNRLEVLHLRDGDETTGLLVQSPEPLDWETTDLTLSKAPPIGTTPTAPDVVKLTELDHTTGTVTALLRDATTLADSGIEYRRDTEMHFDPTPYGAQFTDRFSDDEVLGSYQFDPAVPADAWSVERSGLTVSTPDTWADALRNADPQSRGHVTLTGSILDSGGIGMLVRYRHPGDYYRLAVTPDEMVLTRQVGNASTELWRGQTPTVAAAFTLRLSFDDERITGSIAGRPVFTVPDPTPDRDGRIGLTLKGEASIRELSYASAQAESVLSADPIGTAEPADWTFVKEPPYSTQLLDWEFTDGELQEHSNIYGFVGGAYAAAGTYGVTGDRSWTDYRVTTNLRSESVGAVGAIGVIVRYQNDGAYYRFSMDSVRSYRRFVRIDGGQADLLWEDDTGYEVGRDYQCTIDCIGDTFVGYLDGEKLFEIEDDTVRQGSVGVYCRSNEGARFSNLQVVAPADSWLPYHEFDMDDPLAAGTRVTVDPGCSDPGATGPLAYSVPQNGPSVSLPESLVYLRMQTAAGPAHDRGFHPEAAYETITDSEILRSQDGTEFLLSRPNGFEPGQYRLTFEKDDSTPPASLDIPWES